MIRRKLALKGVEWRIEALYNVLPTDAPLAIQALEKVGVGRNDKERVLELFDEPNRGCTLSDIDSRMSVVCIGWAMNRRETVNTIVHEVDHVQRDICEYYGIPLGTERAAYIQGELASRMII